MFGVCLGGVKGVFVRCLGGFGEDRGECLAVSNEFVIHQPNE